MVCCQGSEYASRLANSTESFFDTHLTTYLCFLSSGNTSDNLRVPPIFFIQIWQLTCASYIFHTNLTTHLRFLYFWCKSDNLPVLLIFFIFDTHLTTYLCFLNLCFLICASYILIQIWKLTCPSYIFDINPTTSLCFLYFSQTTDNLLVLPLFLI